MCGTCLQSVAACWSMVGSSTDSPHASAYLGTHNHPHFQAHLYWLGTVQLPSFRIYFHVKGLDGIISHCLAKVCWF